MTKERQIDLYFLDARAKLIDLAAYLDRVKSAEGQDDYRHQALLRALPLLLEALPSGQSRAQAVLEAFSDKSSEPSGEGADLAPASGAPR